MLRGATKTGNPGIRDRVPGELLTWLLPADDPPENAGLGLAVQTDY
jgi:hypothetical protein